MAAEGDDKDLREVKAILRGLQRIGGRLPQVEAAGEQTGAADDPRARSREQSSSRAHIRSGDAGSPAEKPRVWRRRLATLAIAILAVGIVVVPAGNLFPRYWPNRWTSYWRSFLSSRPVTVSGGITSTVVTSERADAAAKTSASTLPAEASQPVPQTRSIDDQSASPGVVTAAANPDIDNAHQLMDSGRITAAREILLRPDLAASQEGAWLLARSFDPNYLATVQSPDASADRRQAEEWYRRWRDIAAENGMVMDDLRLKRIINSME
jgi:hypothetical protein